MTITMIRCQGGQGRSDRSLRAGRRRDPARDRRGRGKAGRAPASSEGSRGRPRGQHEHRAAGAAGTPRRGAARVPTRAWHLGRRNARARRGRSRERRSSSTSPAIRDTGSTSSSRSSRTSVRWVSERSASTGRGEPNGGEKDVEAHQRDRQAGASMGDSGASIRTPVRRRRRSGCRRCLVRRPTLGSVRSGPPASVRVGYGVEERELEAVSLGSVSYPPVQPAAFSCCLRRAAIGATMERKRAAVASVASSVVLDM